MTAADIDNDGFTDLVDESVRWFENPYDEMAVDDPTSDDPNDDLTLNGAGIPSSFALHPAFPNPFNASTTLHLALPQPSDVTVSVFNITGQHVATLADGPLPAGVHPLTWDASTLTSGIYFIHASVLGQMDRVQKVMLVR